MITYNQQLIEKLLASNSVLRRKVALLETIIEQLDLNWIKPGIKAESSGYAREEFQQYLDWDQQKENQIDNVVNRLCLLENLAILTFQFDNAYIDSFISNMPTVIGIMESDKEVKERQRKACRDMYRLHDELVDMFQELGMLTK